MKMKAKWEYIGKGIYFLGIPARNLDEAELSEEEVKLVSSSGLYRLGRPVRSRKEDQDGDHATEANSSR